MHVRRQQASKVVTAITLSLVVVVSVALYYAHRVLQQHHFRHCRADLLKVVFYDRSPLCTQTATLLRFIEMIYHQALVHMTNHAFNLMRSGLTIIGALLR